MLRKAALMCLCVSERALKTLMDLYPLAKGSTLLGAPALCWLGRDYCYSTISYQTGGDLQPPPANGTLNPAAFTHKVTFQRRLQIVLFTFNRSSIS